MNSSASCRLAARPSRWVLAAWNEEKSEVVPEIDLPSSLEWKQRLRKRQPVVIRGLASSWGTHRWTFEEVAARVGARPVPVVRLHDGLLGYRKHSGMDYVEKPFDAFARHVTGDDPEWFLQLNPDKFLPELVRDLELPIHSHGAHWRDRKITIAGIGTTTPLHRELPDNLFTVFCGEKEVALFSPSDSRHLYGFGPLSGIPHLSEVDPRRCEADRYPRLRRSRPFHCRLQAGDAMLIPRGWWHAVHTIEPSIALGSWWAVGVRSLLPRTAAAYKWLLGIRT